jgi:hypothetical protein
MITNPDLATQLAREHQRQMHAQASQQRHQHGRPVPRTPNAVVGIFRRLAASIARADRAAARRHLASSPAPARPTTRPGPARARRA